MTGRIPLKLVFILLFTLFLTFPAFAGSWAVITLIDLPEQVYAGQPLTVRFAVRQHGVHLLGGLQPTLLANNRQSGEKIVISAQPEKMDGYYQASLTLPSPGKWTWSIQAFTMKQRMPDLSVLAEDQPEINSRPASPRNAAFTAAFLLIGLAALTFLTRRPIQWSALLSIAALFTLGYGFAMASPGTGSTPTVETDRSAADRGEQLFLAKGCVVCHAHQKVKTNADQLSVQIGPDLTQFQADPAYLRMWLADPPGVKPNTTMPDLELSESDIEALIAFLNDVKSLDENMQ